ncbi:MAG TPA: tripartite tricarboxylate transporter substrate binding protein [Burkholderiaceae bacterium]|nr:tripartite tricarboxylate transporter substrate binding protein [Burkholderiaceae bacterium]
MKRFGTLLLAGAVAFAAFGASAQERPTARIVVPFAAGGPNDVVARLAAKGLTEVLGQNIIVDNKPGATGAIGTQFVADSAPDGLTMLLASSSSMSTGPLLMPSVRFDPVKDFIPVDLIALDENILVVHPSVEVKTTQELIDYAKAHPNDLNYSTSGIGSSYHLGTQLFSSRAGIEMTHVPYKGTAPAVLDLLAGRVQVQFQAVSQARGNIESGKVRPLAIASPKRHPAFPDIPTIAESANLPGFSFMTWMGLFFPAGTPEAEVERMRTALHKAMQIPELKKRITDLGMQPTSESPEAIAAQIEGDLARWGEVIKAGNISLQ